MYKMDIAIGACKIFILAAGNQRLLGHVLILKDKGSNLKITETWRSGNKRDKNSLLRRDMDRIDSIIKRIKNVHRSMNKASAV